MLWLSAAAMPKLLWLWRNIPGCCETHWGRGSQNHTDHTMGWNPTGTCRQQRAGQGRAGRGGAHTHGCAGQSRVAAALRRVRTKHRDTELQTGRWPALLATAWRRPPGREAWPRSEAARPLCGRPTGSMSVTGMLPVRLSPLVWGDPQRARSCTKPTPPAASRRRATPAPSSRPYIDPAEPG